MWSFPASFMAEFFDNHGMFSLRDRPRWRTVSGGSGSYVEAIAAPWRDRVRLGAPVRGIERLPGRVRIEAEGCESEEFDEVVIATHSDQALAMLADPSEAEREILGAIPYQRNEAVLHTDASLLPRRRTAWSSWNFHLAPEPAGAHHRHLLDEQPAAAARRARVPAHPQPRRGDRPGARCCAASATTTPSTPPRASPPRPGTPRSAACAAPTTAAPTGAGASTRTASSAPCAPASRSPPHGPWPSQRWPHERLRRLRGLGPPPPLRAGRAQFRYRLFLMYLDLDELPGVLDPYPLLSARRPAPARFRRADFMGDPARPLAECARDAVEAETGAAPAGPVRLLANLRYLGHAFNPVSFYYCFDRAGERVEAVVADVNNIPWGERHPYVLARGEREGPVLSDELDKALHVSPLMGMDQTYAFRASRARRAAQRPHRVAPAEGDGGGSPSTRRSRCAAASSAGAPPEPDARPLPGDVAAGRGEDLRAVAAAEAEGRALLPPPRGRRPKGFISP